MANADDVKEMIRKRLEERTAASAEPEVESGPETETFSEEEIAAINKELEDHDPEGLYEAGEDEAGFEEVAGWEDFDPDLMNAFFEEGRQAYYNGIDQDQMPYVAEDFEDPQHTDIVSEAWNEGWYAAHGETWTALTLLAARDLITAKDEDQMVKAMTEMQQAVKVLEDGVVDFDGLAEEFRPE